MSNHICNSEKVILFIICFWNNIMQFFKYYQSRKMLSWREEGNISWQQFIIGFWYGFTEVIDQPGNPMT